MGRKPKKVEINYPPLTLRKWRPPKRDLPHDPWKKQVFRRKPLFPKTKYFPLCTVERTWHHYHIIARDCRIIFGPYAQTHKRYIPKYRGYTGPANCCAAIAFSRILPMEQWVEQTVFYILECGIRIHDDSFALFHAKEPTPNEVVNNFFIGDVFFTLAINNGSKRGIILKKDMRDITELMNTVLEYFETRMFCVIFIDRYFMGVWKWLGSYYLFDPNDRDSNGRRLTTPTGRASIMRFKSLRNLVLWFTDDHLYLTEDITWVLTPVEIKKFTKVDLRPPDSLAAFAKVTKPPNLDLTPSKETVGTAAMAASEGEAQKTVKVAEADELATPSEVTLKEPTNYDDIVRKPFQRPHPPSISYFMPVVPDTMGIIRASYNQNDPKFSRFPGRQSLANCVAAITMLREFKSKYWIKKILDEILIAGETIFASVKHALSGDQVLGLREFPNKITIGTNTFVPEIEENTVIGRLNSSVIEVLDLLPSLGEFFKEYDTGIIRGPLMVSVWKENGKYYMFDPNERDDKGRAIPIYEPVDTDKGVIENFPPPVVGSACLTWFRNLSDLVNLYLNNVSRELLKSYFYISKVEVKNYIDDPVPWFSFLPLGLDKWILRGTIAQNNAQFQSTSRNVQCTAIAAMAIVYANLRNMDIWDRNTVDEIVYQGDLLYNECVEMLKSKNKFVDPMLMIAEMPRKFMVNERSLVLEIDDCIINGPINEGGTPEFPSMKDGVWEFFKSYDSAVLTSRHMSVALWKDKEAYYYFDSHARNKEGHADCTGTACVIRTLTIDDLLDAVQCNFVADNLNVYNLSYVAVNLLPEGGWLPEIGNYTQLNQCKAILRGYTHQGLHELFDINSDKQTIANTLVALGMTKILPSVHWTRETIDHILKIGDDLYERTKRQFCEDDLVVRKDDDESRVRDEDDAIGEEITLENVIKSFRIGLNQLTVTAEHANAQVGVFEEDPYRSYQPKFVTGDQRGGAGGGVPGAGDDESGPLEFEEKGPCLPIVLANFMDKDDEAGKECLLISEPLTLALWRDESFFYVFDPFGRDKEGNVYGRDLWSAKIYSPMYWYGGEEMGEGGMRMLNGEDAPPPNSLAERQNAGNEEEGEDDEAEGEAGEGGGMLEMEREIIDYTDARACVLMFCTMKELIDHIISNVPPNKRDMSFTLVPISFENRAAFRPVGDTVDWFMFKVLEADTWILRGTVSMNDPRYPLDNRGCQAPAMSALGCVYARLYSIAEFNSSVVDDIVKYGDRLHTLTRMRREKRLIDAGLSDTDISISVRRPYATDEIEKEFYVAGTYLVELVVDTNVVKGDLVAKDPPPLISEEVSVNTGAGTGSSGGTDKSIVRSSMVAPAAPVLTLKQALLLFFTEHIFGVLNCKGTSVAVWHFNEFYYMFDPDERGPNGIAEINGVACITRHENIEKLIEIFKKNLRVEGSNDFFIDAVNAKVKKTPKPEAKVEKVIVTDPKISAFEEVEEGKMILRGDYNMNNPKFGQNTDATAACDALVAIAMAVLRKSTTWTRLVIDDVLVIGNCLYDMTQDYMQDDFNPWEDKMTLEMVCKEFPIGDHMARCELGDDTQSGLLYIKDPQILNLRKGCEKFFVRNRYGVVTSEPLTAAIWTEDNLFYMFDPYPRSSTGLCSMSGVACLMVFSSLKLLSDHFLYNCPREQCDLEFIITPVLCDLSEKKKVKVPTLKKCEILRWQKLELDEDEKRPPPRRRRSSVTARSLLPDGRRCRICNRPPRVRRRASKAAESSTTITEAKKKQVRELADAKLRKEREALLRKMLREFYPANERVAVLRAHYSENSKKYSEWSRGFQALPNCVTALVMARLHDIGSWTFRNIEIVLDSGDMLYKNSFMYFRPEHPLLGLKNVQRRFYIQHIAITIEIYMPIIKGQFTRDVLQVGMTNFLMQEKAGILEIRWDKTIRFFLAVFQRAGSFYVFYPYDMDETGHHDVQGAACVLRFAAIEDMVDNIAENYEMDGESRFGLAAVGFDIGSKVDYCCD